MFPIFDGFVIRPISAQALILSRHGVITLPSKSDFSRGCQKNDMERLSVIILAAGKGTRMNSSTAKVLHRIRGKPMIQLVVDQAACLDPGSVIVVVGVQADQVKQVVSSIYPAVRFASQVHQLGTGHAVSCAVSELPDNAEHALILCGDVPFIKAATLSRLVDTHMREENIITILGASVDDPFGYGRLVLSEQGRVLRIVEEADATDAEKRIKYVNTGIYCVNRLAMEKMLKQISTDNAQNEMYLTDIVGVAAENSLKIGMITCESVTEILGINTIQDLEKAEAVISSDEKP